VVNKGNLYLIQVQPFWWVNIYYTYDHHTNNW